MQESEGGWDRLRRLAANLPEVTEGTSYGNASLKVRGKSFATLKKDGTLVLLCALEQKELLLEGAPEIFYETPHYKGWPAVLVRLEAISDRELEVRLEQAWHRHAPKSLTRARRPPPLASAED